MTTETQSPQGSESHKGGLTITEKAEAFRAAVKRGGFSRVRLPFGFVSDH